ncbi:MAG: M18 family aminopeptidase, partial [Fibrobacter sp.]|nr:M18 family aminopeptidase [Fibrobacter sp.]
MNFLDFLNNSVTPYHTVQNLKQLLEPAGAEIKFFERGGALIAVRLPRAASVESRFRIALAHTDYPTLKITPNPDCSAAGVRT